MQIKPLLIAPLVFILCGQIHAQDQAAHTPQLYNGFNKQRLIISMGMGFPNIYRYSYDEPQGYTHIKTTGFLPVHLKLEKAITNKIGLVAGIAYSTFHYSYYGWAYFPGYKQQVIYYDDVNTLSWSLSANYHFDKLINNPRLDTYAGAGACINYLHYRYGNIPPYREATSKIQLLPQVRAGIRYYIDPSFSAYSELGFDGLSIWQLGVSLSFAAH